MPQLGNRQALIRKNIGSKIPGNAFKNATESPQLRGAPAPAASPPSPSPMPWDAAAAGSEASALKRRNDELSGLSSQWNLEQQSYGLEGPYANHMSNPYSKAALLQRSYDNAKRGTTNSAGLNLYSGSTLNAQNRNTFHYGEGYDSLQKAYASDYAQNQQQRLAAENNYGEAVANAQWERINAGLKEEPEAAPAGSGPGASGTVGTAGRRGRQIKRNVSIGRNRRA